MLAGARPGRGHGLRHQLADVRRRALDVQRQGVGAPERQEVIDHGREARHLVLDRPKLRSARPRGLTAPQNGRVGADHGQRVAQVVTDLRDVEPALAVEIAQAGRECLERAGHTADFAAAGDECDVAVAVADPLGGEHDRLEMLTMTSAGALEQPHADEHEHEPDRCEPLGLDQQQIALDVLRRAARGEHAAPAHVPLGDGAESGRAARAGSRDQRRIAAGCAALEPGQTRARNVRDAALPQRGRRSVERAHQAGPALAGDAVVHPRDDEQARLPPARAQRRARPRSTGVLRAARSAAAA